MMRRFQAEQSAFQSSGEQNRCKPAAVVIKPGRSAAPVKAAVISLGAILLAVASVTAHAQTQTLPPPKPTTQPKVSTSSGVRLGPAAPVTYANRFEVYGGLNFMNFQAGQTLPKRMNLGGGEFEGTWWMTHHLGIAAEYRGEAGTTPVFPNPYDINRPLVYMNMALFGVQYRGPKNQHAAIDYHAYAGPSYGVFDGGTDGNGVLAGSATQKAAAVGLYSNRWAPVVALGGSLDFNQSKNWAVRLSPDLIIEHFGNETREFFAISGGIVYRIGKR